MSNRGNFFVCLAVISLGIFASIGSYVYTDHKNSEYEINKLAAIAYRSHEDSSSEASTECSEENELDVNEPDFDSRAFTASVDIMSLQKANPDIFAWITVHGTVIDYPIAQHPTNDAYYLEHGPEGFKSSHGCPFIEVCDSTTFQDYITVVYGHNMNDGSMFAKLHDFENPEFLKEHRDITVTTAEHVMTYKIFAAVMYSDAYIPYYYDDTVAADRTAFLNSLETDIVTDRSIILKDETVSANDHIIVLSTCDKKLRSSRFLVVAVLKQIDGKEVKAK